MWLEKNKTFLLCVITLCLSFWGSYVNMIDPETLKEIIWGALGTYGVRSVGGKFAVGYNNKHNKADGTMSGDHSS